MGPKNRLLATSGQRRRCNYALHNHRWTQETPQCHSGGLAWGQNGNCCTRVDFEPVSYWNTSDRQPSLSLSNISKQTDYSGDIKIIGMIKNNESISVDYPSIIGTYYNSSGKVIDCNFTFANTYPLAQGQSSSFEMYTNAAANITVNYALQTDGNL